MKKWLRNRKAVSPVIAALLLIAISVAAAVLTYSWVMSMVGTQGRQAQTSVRIDLVEFKGAVGGTDDYIEITFRNSGSVEAVIEMIYVTKPDGTVLREDYSAAGGNVIPTGDIKTMTFDFDQTLTVDWVISTAYIIKAVTDIGFMVEGTYYSPSVHTVA